MNWSIFKNSYILSEHVAEVFGQYIPKLSTLCYTLMPAVVLFVIVF